MIKSLFTFIGYMVVGTVVFISTFFWLLAHLIIDFIGVGLSTFWKWMTGRR